MSAPRSGEGRGHAGDPPAHPRRPPGPTTAGWGYQYLRTPDAGLGLASYAATLVLAGRRADQPPASHPWLSLALGAKADAAGGLLLTVEQGTKHRRFCSWCLAAAALSVATVPVVTPEVRAAWRALRRS
ncbi:MAG: vitamin K epoxide reductase family protein [Acidimicrobiales bacterium]